MLLILLAYFQVKYYNDVRIHNFGNIGLKGKIHAFIAPYITKLIDEKQYNSIDIRQNILSIHNQHFYENFNKYPNIIDLCCGTGTSTYNNQSGIDTSREMINQANVLQTRKNRLTSKKTQTFYTQANAEDYGNTKEFTTATIMFAFHEMPNYAHNKIIKNAKRITSHDIIIIDISPNYKPSILMLSGEPYLLNYQKTIENILQKHGFQYIELLKNHVGIWYFSHL